MLEQWHGGIAIARGQEPANKHTVTEASQRQVKTLAAMGTRQEDIATVMDIGLRTLQRRYPSELSHGSIEANSKVAQSLFQIATGVGEDGKREKGAVTAAIFWLKVRARWKETSVLEHVVDANPVTAQDAHDELKRLIGKHQEAAVDKREFEEAEERSAVALEEPETNGKATNGHIVPRKKGSNGKGAVE